MSGKNEQGSMDVKQKNVLHAPLHKLSSPISTPSNLPSSLHAGFCTSTNPIAAALTSAFIDTLSSTTSTDLRKAGVGPGQRFCLEASAWKQIADKGGEGVPRVKLESSHVEALESVELDVLKRWEASRDNDSKHGAERPGPGNWVRESGEIGGKEPRA
ncbi:hypothetical protein BDU57DRAFT_556235 [Ampelomyces quisqualis]|uniref:Uncharacterized protein n=1 Tax=Ampelomyces quisqualis TaxID=50730 RepID=A0A6A5QLW3_AMPQU|nr:hypothetical protein BDU57DRAFT_556235 [Ampelomyces quisqualis]